MLFNSHFQSEDIIPNSASIALQFNLEFMGLFASVGNSLVLILANLGIRSKTLLSLAFANIIFENSNQLT